MKFTQTAKCRKYVTDHQDGPFYEAHVDRGHLWPSGKSGVIIGCAVRRAAKRPDKAALLAWNDATKQLLNYLEGSVQV